MLYRVGRLLENGDTAGFITILKKYYEAFPYDLLYKDKEKTYQLLFHAFFRLYNAGQMFFGEASSKKNHS